MATTLFFAFPGGGHVIPTLPIIAELVRQGEHVHYFALPEFQSRVEATDAQFRAYSPEFPLANEQTFARFRRNLSNAIQVELETSRWVLQHLAPELAGTPPAYVMHDALASWGWYLKQVWHVPSIAMFPTFVYTEANTVSQHVPLKARIRGFVRGIYQSPSGALANELSKKYHLPPVKPLARLMQNRGDLNLVLTSRELQPGAQALDETRFKFIGPSITPRPDTTAFPFHELDGRPLILIALGTVFNNRPSFYRACYQAFADTPWQIVLSAGTHTDLAQLLAAPPNFIVRPFVPQLELLQRARVFVSHGGMNSVNESLYYNVPLIMLPQGADHGWIASRVAELGAGIQLGREADGEQLRRAVQEIFSQPRYTQAAFQIGASLRATGGADEAAQAILHFTSSQTI